MQNVSGEERKTPPSIEQLKKTHPLIEKYIEFAKQWAIKEDVVLYLAHYIPQTPLLEKILFSIPFAPKHYTLRVNPLKTTKKQVIEHLYNLYYKQKYRTLEEFAKEAEGKNIVNSKEDLSFIFLPIEGPYTLSPMEKKIFCDKFAAESIMMGADLYIPGIREIPQKILTGECVSLHIMPSQLKNLTQDSQPSLIKKTLARGKAVRPSSDFTKIKKGIFVKNEQSIYKTFPYKESSLYYEGKISDQSLPALIAIHSLVSYLKKKKEIIEKTKNEGDPLMILDTCSAPGHKTAALAELLQNKTSVFGKNYKIFSIDRSSKRLNHLKEDIKRLGIKNIEILPIRLEKLLKKRPDLYASADILIFDPPCSALGLRPKLFIDKSYSQLTDFFMNQRRLLKLVHPLIKPGGLLFYNTCTVVSIENEGIVSYAKNKLGYEILPLSPPSFKGLQKGFIYEGINEEEQQNLFHFFPEKNEGSGYFFALLRKKQDTQK